MSDDQMYRKIAGRNKEFFQKRSSEYKRSSPPLETLYFRREVGRKGAIVLCLTAPDSIYPKRNTTVEIARLSGGEASGFFDHMIDGTKPLKQVSWFPATDKKILRLFMALMDTRANAMRMFGAINEDNGKPWYAIQAQAAFSHRSMRPGTRLAKELEHLKDLHEHAVDLQSHKLDNKLFTTGARRRFDEAATLPPHKKLLRFARRAFS